MREVVQITQCRTVRFANGERFPLVVDARGIPLTAATRYLANRRNRALNTLENTARTVAKVHDFLESRDINIAERVAAGSALTMDEATALRDHLRTIGRRTEIILTRSSLRDPHISRSGVVGHAEWYARCRRARAYLKWLIYTEMERASSTSFERIRFEVEKLESRLTDLRSPPDRWEQTSLSAEQRDALIETVTVGSPKNPFSPTQQLRNMALVAAYYETGLRKSELLVLRRDDLLPPALEPQLRLARRPHDEDDKRAKMPSVKTMPRTLPIASDLYILLTSYVAVDRSRLRKQFRERGDRSALKRLDQNPYVFISSTGSALSLSSVHKIFDTLRNADPRLPINLSPHVLRRAWNDRFSEYCYGKGFPEDGRAQREFYMGWAAHSRQAERYSRQSTSNAVALAILNTQQRWSSWEQAQP